MNICGMTHYFFGYRAFTMNPTWWYMSLALYLIPTTCLIWFTWDKLSLRYGIIIAYLVTLLFYRHEYLQYTPVVYSAVVVIKFERYLQCHQNLQYVASVVGILVWLYYRLLVSGQWNCMADALVAFPLIKILLPGIRKFSIMTYIGKKSAGIFYTHTLIYTWPWTSGFVCFTGIAPIIFVSLIFTSLLYSSVIDCAISELFLLTRRVLS